MTKITNKKSLLNIFKRETSLEFEIWYLYFV